MRALVVLLAAASFAQTRKEAPYPPPGKLVDVGGYRVHVNCVGEGSPTVMIVGGGFSFDWSLVQPEIARWTRVCTYDASGTAWSDPGAGRGCPAWMNEVHELLQRAQVKGAYVLVGFSAGAIVARLYATTYPDETAGMVIVDHAFLPKPVTNAPPAGAAGDLNGVDTPPAVLSMTPVIFSHEDEPGFRNLPKQAQELDRWANSINPDLPTEETANQCMSAAEAAAQGRSYPLGEMPLVVISTGNDAAGYAELQSHLLALSRNSRQLMALKSFHSIEISQPDVVIDGIRRVITAARNHASLKNAP
ncbi:MAG TPA: alpha/beta hydrolase [Bryobacteraceae bacterium]|nr:alpha/beta hydrolase [Bryobacteraceae bacterium]